VSIRKSIYGQMHKRTDPLVQEGGA